jgi:hypothetical protein
LSEELIKGGPSRETGSCFRHGNREELSVSVGAVEGAKRSEVSSDSVLANCDELRKPLPAYGTSNLILNIDETGLSVRSMKGKTRKLVFVKRCTVRPTFHEEKYVAHVSLVAIAPLTARH